MPWADAQSMKELVGYAYDEYRRLGQQAVDFYKTVGEQYYQHIRKPWVPVEADKPLARPVEEYPDMTVLPLESFDYNVGDTFEIPSDVVDLDARWYREEYKDDFPIYDSVVEGDCQASLAFNGFELLLRFPDNGKLKVSDTSEEGVSDAWSRMEEIGYHNTLRDLSRVREMLSLSDWSFVRLIENLSVAVYGTAASPESILLQAFVLNRFGFSQCLGRASDNSLHRLLAMDAPVYDFKPYGFNGKVFYSSEENPPQKLFLTGLELNGERPMRLKINPEEKFYNAQSSEKKYASKRYPNLCVTVSTNLPKMSFYNDYPMYYTGDNPLSTYLHYAMVPLSDDIKASVYPSLENAVRGRNELEAVNILLNFVQTSFKYAKDKDVWGCERYFYADELWRYGSGDCEDKSILFSCLVRDILRLPVALVYWPGHLSCAVCFSDSVKGAYFNVKGRRYISCDPTYENAYAGAVMDKYSDKHALIIIVP